MYLRDILHLVQSISASFKLTNHRSHTAIKRYEQLLHHLNWPITALVLLVSPNYIFTMPSLKTLVCNIAQIWTEIENTNKHWPLFLPYSLDQFLDGFWHRVGVLCVLLISGWILRFYSQLLCCHHHVACSINQGSSSIRDWSLGTLGIWWDFGWDGGEFRIWCKGCESLDSLDQWFGSLGTLLTVVVTEVTVQALWKGKIDQAVWFGLVLFCVV